MDMDNNIAIILVCIGLILFIYWCTRQSNKSNESEQVTQTPSSSISTISENSSQLNTFWPTTFSEHQYLSINGEPADCRITQLDQDPYNNVTQQQISSNVKAREDYIKKRDQKLLQFRSIQKQLIQQQFLPPYYPILICVDARPKGIGGYCINFIQKICYYYTFPINILPWDLQNDTRRGDANEFEMKNLMFSLFLWEQQIKTYKYVQIHTDNSAINSPSSPYGSKAMDFITHLTNCNGVQTNQNLHINSEMDPEDFSKYIQPADDLSRWEINECENFLRSIYRIEHFQKTHIPKSQNRPMEKIRYVPTIYYQEYIDTVKERIRNWRKYPCQRCGFMVEDTSSLHESISESG